MRAASRRLVKGLAKSFKLPPTVRIVMTLLARNEADIVDAQIAFHLNAGVDYVVAMDNGSGDGTTEILESYARDGHLHLTRDEGDLSQEEWVTGLARRAATDFGADWVINSDADEFWWPRGGSLKDVFAAIPARFGSIRGMWRHFPPRPGGDDFFAERMTVRVLNPGADDNSPWSPRFKTAHRADPEVTVVSGNHRALGRDLLPLSGWYPVDVLHFPFRSLEQFREKLLRRWALDTSRHRSAAHDADRSGRMQEFYESHLVDDDALARGVKEGTLAVDTRLRDALRRMRAEPDRPLSFTEDAVDEGYLSELAMLAAGDPHVLAQRKAEDLEARLNALEHRHSSRIVNAVSQRLRRAAS
jgi:hypothetical protein